EWLGIPRVGRRLESTPLAAASLLCLLREANCQPPRTLGPVYRRGVSDSQTKRAAPIAAGALSEFRPVSPPRPPNASGQWSDLTLEPYQIVTENGLRSRVPAMLGDSCTASLCTKIGGSRPIFPHPPGSKVCELRRGDESSLRALPKAISALSQLCHLEPIESRASVNAIPPALGHGPAYALDGFLYRSGE